MTPEEFFSQAITNNFSMERRPGERTAIYYLRKHGYLKCIKRHYKTWWVLKERATRPFTLGKRTFEAGEIR